MSIRAIVPAVLMLLHFCGLFASTCALADMPMQNLTPPNLGYSGLPYVLDIRSGLDDKSPMSITAGEAPQFIAAILAYGTVKTSNNQKIENIYEPLCRFVESFPTGLLYIGSQVRTTANTSLYAQDFSYSITSSRTDIDGQALLLPRGNGYTIGGKQDLTAPRLTFLRALNRLRHLLSTPLNNSKRGDKTLLDFFHSLHDTTLPAAQARRPNNVTLADVVGQLVKEDFYSNDPLVTNSTLDSTTLVYAINKITVNKNPLFDTISDASNALIDAYNALSNATRFSFACGYSHVTYGEGWNAGVGISARLQWLTHNRTICPGQSDFYGAIKLQYQGGNYPGMMSTAREQLSGVRTGLSIYWQNQIPYLVKNSQTNIKNYRWTTQAGLELVLSSGLASKEEYDAFFRYRDLCSGSETTLSVGKDARNYVFVNIGFGYSYPTVHGERQPNSENNINGGKGCITNTDQAKQVDDLLLPYSLAFPK